MSATVVVRHPHGEPSDLIRSVSRALRVLEAVGQTPRGLTVKQIARRCELTTATTYHLIRTLAYEGYVTRREDGTYVVGLEIADRFRELVAAFRGAPVGDGRPAPVGRGHRLQPLPRHLRRWPDRDHQRRRGAEVAAHRGPGPRLRRRRPRHRPGQGAAQHAHARPAAALPQGPGHAHVHRPHPDPARGARGRPARGRTARHCRPRSHSSGTASAAPRWWCTPTATRNGGSCWPARCPPTTCSSTRTEIRGQLHGRRPRRGRVARRPAMADDRRTRG